VINAIADPPRSRLSRAQAFILHPRFGFSAGPARSKYSAQCHESPASPESWAMLPTQVMISGDRRTACVEIEMLEGGMLTSCH
jgi:hypothetical protein